jgi:hypothetical protein
LILSFEYTHVPVAFLHLSFCADELASAVAHTIVKGAPIHAFFRNVATPTVEDVVFKLTFVNVVLALSANAL